MIPDAHVPPEYLGNMLRSIGIDKSSQVKFMNAFMNSDRYLAIDITNVLSMIDNIEATLGHNSKDEYLPQVHIPFLFTLTQDRPAYFRILPRSIN